MADFIKTQAGIVGAALQAALDCKQKAKAIESFADSIDPLVEGEHAKELVQSVREGAAKLSHWLTVLYTRNAKEVFQAHS